jgi:hypothetical protein
LLDYMVRCCVLVSTHSYQSRNIPKPSLVHSHHSIQFLPANIQIHHQTWYTQKENSPWSSNSLTKTWRSTWTFVIRVLTFPFLNHFYFNSWLGWHTAIITASFIGIWNHPIYWSIERDSWNWRTLDWRGLSEYQFGPIRTKSSHYGTGRLTYCWAVASIVRQWTFGVWDVFLRKWPMEGMFFM